MAVFDPNDWWDGRFWLAPADHRERRRANAINREVAQRWLAALAFCLCFASLGPPDQVPLAFAGLLLLAGLVAAAAAFARREHPLSPHLTAWDEAAWSLTLSLGLAHWAAATAP
jgi:hypothetical protein